MADRKTILLLKMMDAAGGSIDATDSHGQMLNYFCDDRGPGIDTFNLAINEKLIRTTFDSICETSTAFLTDAGRAAITGNDSKGGAT